MLMHPDTHALVLGAISLWVHGSLISLWLQLKCCVCVCPPPHAFDSIMTFINVALWSSTVWTRARTIRCKYIQTFPTMQLLVPAQACRLCVCANGKFKSSPLPFTMRSGAAIVGEVNISFECHWTEATDKKTRSALGHLMQYKIIYSRSFHQLGCCASVKCTSIQWKVVFDMLLIFQVPPSGIFFIVGGRK